MARGLSVSNVVNVSVYLSPIAAGYRNFGVALIMGSSDVIDVAERVRPYNTIDEVAAEFGTSSEEYKAALAYFSQQPRPRIVYLGRWAQVASVATLNGGTLSDANQDVVAVWNPITTGSLQITINGTLRTAATLNFSGATNMNNVASIIQAALSAYATVVWDAVYERFVVKSLTTGATATLTYASPTGSGTDISALTGLSSASASAPVNGIAAEAPLDAVLAAANASGEWYGLAFATATMPSDNQLLDVSAYIEGSDRNRIHAITATSAQVLDPLITTDIASRAKTLNYKRTFTQYSKVGNGKYAAVSAMARAFTVDFNASNTTMTLKFKQEPGVVAETLTLAQAVALRNKNANVFVNYDNDTAILQEGKMANGYFFDEVHNSDWLANRVQNDLWNVLYQSQTKIPQTDAGMTQLIAAAENGCLQAVANGMAAPGLWNGPDIGVLKNGNPLSKGFYIYMPLVATQAQADREARRAPTMQIAIKLAGAVHFVDCIININR